jgi:hypothetical protein
MSNYLHGSRFNYFGKYVAWPGHNLLSRTQSTHSATGVRSRRLESIPHRATEFAFIRRVAISSANTLCASGTPHCGVKTQVLLLNSHLGLVAALWMRGATLLRLQMISFRGCYWSKTKIYVFFTTEIQRFWNHFSFCRQECKHNWISAILSKDCIHKLMYSIIYIHTHRVLYLCFSFETRFLMQTF